MTTMEETYRTESITGTSWARFRAATLVTELGADPVMHFQEQSVATWDTRTKRTVVDIGGCSLDLSNPLATFELRNPETGASISETMTHAELLRAIYSAWRAAAAARDAA